MIVFREPPSSALATGAERPASMLTGAIPLCDESILVRTLGPRDGCEFPEASTASTSPLVDTEAAPPPTIIFELDSEEFGPALGSANPIGPWGVEPGAPAGGASMKTVHPFASDAPPGSAAAGAGAGCAGAGGGVGVAAADLPPAPGSGASMNTVQPR